jgi:phosphoglycerate kinase
MPSIQTYNFQNQKALIRVDFNVPLNKDHQIEDAIRIDQAIPTIQKVCDDGGSAILISHLGRPKQGYQATLSLAHLVPYLSQCLHKPVDFATDCIGADAQEKAKNLQPGQVLLLENLRFHTGEEQGDPNFAQTLASLADIYINDAFGVAHRPHASVTTITQYFKYKFAGKLLQTEIDHANQLLQHAQKPFTAIIGGAKIADKLPAIQSLLNQVDYLLIGGGVANTFQKALGGEVGNSLVETDQLELAFNLWRQAQQEGVRIVLPSDVVIASQLSEDAHTAVTASNQVPSNTSAYDIGPKTQIAFNQVIQNSKTILWSGPIGVFELARFSTGTQAVVAAIAQATAQGAFSLVGGGDSAHATQSLGYTNQVSYISTGGGALLSYLAARTLPGIEALTSNFLNKTGDMPKNLHL